MASAKVSTKRRLGTCVEAGTAIHKKTETRQGQIQGHLRSRNCQKPLHTGYGRGQTRPPGKRLLSVEELFTPLHPDDSQTHCRPGLAQRPTGEATFLFTAIQKWLLHPIFRGWFCPQGSPRSLLGHLLRNPRSPQLQLPRPSARPHRHPRLPSPSSEGVLCVQP